MSRRAKYFTFVISYNFFGSAILFLEMHRSNGVSKFIRNDIPDFIPEFIATLTLPVYAPSVLMGMFAIDPEHYYLFYVIQAGIFIAGMLLTHFYIKNKKH